MLELPEYTIRPFKMKNLGGRQPDTELAKVNVVEGEGAYGSLENKDSPRIRPSRGERGIQVESNSDVNDCNLPRTGYIIDLYRLVISFELFIWLISLLLPYGSSPNPKMIPKNLPRNSEEMFYLGCHMSSETRIKFIKRKL